ncbi:hypothetical protein [Sulfuriflexus mobilis]|nr:hypothetical protein [Sulfuriflexus mobilis]
MRRRKPDLLLLMTIVIGLGVVVSGYALDMGERKTLPIQQANN